MNKPNILIFNPDQMRADALHHLGNEASHTPHFDALTQEGLSFANCYCQNPVCVPSRCSFMTGLYPHNRGHRTMMHLLRRGEENLLKELKDGGYYTWMNGRGDLLAGQDARWIKACVNKVADTAGTNLNDKAEPRGEKGSDNYFSFYQGVLQTDSPDGTSRDHDVAYTEACIDMIKKRPKDKPLAMFLALNNPHPPYKTEQKYLDLTDTSKLPKRAPTLQGNEGKPSMEYGLLKNLGLSGWTEERFDKLRAVYLGMVAKCDDLFGSVVQTLKEEGIYDNTAIIVISDHGDYTGDYGLVEKAQNCFPDCLTGVPFIVKPPKNMQGRTGVTDTMTELLDLYATTLDFAGITPHHDHFSRSVLPIIRGESAENRQFVFSEGGRRHGETQCMESIGKKTIGISDMYDPRISLQESEGPEHTLATMIRSKDYKYVHRLYESDEFYDLALGESKNEIANPAYADIIKEMRSKMFDWYLDTASTVPRDYDQRFTPDFYIAAAKNAGQPAIAVLVFKFFLKVLKKPFDETVGLLSGLAEKFNSVNK